MSLFLPNIPQPSDNLDFSQGQLLSNNQGLDTVFGVDHYKFSDATANKGFHNTVTTPLIVGSAHPTTTTNPIFYAMQDFAAVGVIQYSRGPTNAVPTPLTDLQSTVAAIVVAPAGTTPILNFTGMNIVYGNLYVLASNIPNSRTTTIYWNGSVIQGLISTGPMQIIQVGNTLTYVNPTAGNQSIYWTFELVRVQ